MRTCAIYVRTYVRTYVRAYVRRRRMGRRRHRRGNRRGKGGGGERPRRPQDREYLDKVGWTPLMYAVKASTFCWRAARAVRSLALAVPRDGQQRLSDVNAVATGSLWPHRTCLHMACESTFVRSQEQLYVVNSLLDAGANIEAETPEGHTPLFCAEAASFGELCKLLQSRGAK